MEASIESKPLSNPFPGLRPFEADEEHLFFGREKEVDELLRRLSRTRFLLVAGSSGTGKSSLVRSGLIPSLQGGFMLKAGSSWRIMVFRPGDNPIGNLAAAMDAPNALACDEELANTSRVLLEATLQRSSLGIVQAVRHARIPPQDNILIVVDQFEELFRFRRTGQNSRDQAVAFFKLLLESTRQQDVPIYIVLTMRSDFLGDCIEFQGLPEAVNDGLYLIPRLTRDELRSAITGPVAVAGGVIAQRLVQRLLNDLADDQDQLPVLQHALMRTWNHWEAQRAEQPSIDIADYEAIGGLQQALSLHAEEAFEETARVEGGQQIAERAFKALTDTYSDPRGVRRAASIRELAAICELPEPEVMQVVEIFRCPGRSFLTPYSSTPLGAQTIVDLSHESLMRCWARLVRWTEEERESAENYLRIAQAASWYADSSGGLWTDPQLETGLQWRHKNRPSSAWAERYDPHFSLAMEFLDRSAERRETERRKERKRKRNARIAISVLSVSFVAIVLLALSFYYQRGRAAGNAKKAEQNARMADTNFSLATAAVGEFLSSAGAHRSREFSESPDLEEFRGQLLDKAKAYYQKLASQKQGNEAVQAEMAKANSNLGDIDRLREMNQDAVSEYTQAIALFEKLSKEHPGDLEYRRDQAYCHMWIGETLRLWLESKNKPAQYTPADAKTQYDQAIAIQMKLHQDAPAEPVYQQELARSYYNRGILLYDNHADPEPDFQRAYGLLKPLVAGNESASQQSTSDLDPAEDLARVENDLGVVYGNRGDYEKAAASYQLAILSISPLRQRQPANTGYNTEAAQYYLNLAGAMKDEHQFAEAKRANDTAHDLVNEIARPSPAVQEMVTKITKMDDWLDKRLPSTVSHSR